MTIPTLAESRAADRRGRRATLALIVLAALGFAAGFYAIVRPADVAWVWNSILHSARKPR